jgi:hypothetical protein
MACVSVAPAIGLEKLLQKQETHASNDSAVAVSATNRICIVLSSLFVLALEFVGETVKSRAPTGVPRNKSSSIQWSHRANPTSEAQGFGQWRRMRSTCSWHSTSVGLLQMVIVEFVSAVCLIPKAFLRCDKSLVRNSSIEW